jgi:hypothetical protein
VGEESDEEVDEERNLKRNLILNLNYFALIQMIAKHSGAQKRLDEQLLRKGLYWETYQIHLDFSFASVTEMLE